MSGFPTFAWTPILAEGLGDLMPLLIVLFVVISAIRAVLQAGRAKEQHKAGGGESEEQRRAREIRDRLRRMMAERRGEAPPPELPEVEPSAPPQPAADRPLPGGVPPLDPFGGSLRRLVEELSPAPRPAALPPVLQRRIDVEPPKPVQPVWAAEPSGYQGEGPALPRPVPVQVRPALELDAEARRRAENRDQLLGDLRDPAGLRRAFLLREILGAPVSMRGSQR